MVGPEDWRERGAWPPKADLLGGLETSLLPQVFPAHVAVSSCMISGGDLWHPIVHPWLLLREAFRLRNNP